MIYSSIPYLKVYSNWILWLHVDNRDYSLFHIEPQSIGYSALSIQVVQATSWLPAARTPGAHPQVLSRLRATHLSEILLKMPELQTLLEFLLMLRPKLIKGRLGFIQLGQEPRTRKARVLCWE